MCGMRRVLAVSGALVALITVLAVTLLLPAPAGAATDVCSRSVVSDGADVLDDARIEQAAAAFGDGVVVKVLSYLTTDGQDLYERILDERARCDGWGFRPGGGRSLLVLAVATEDRQLASHYDGRAQDRFESAREHAEVDGMGAGFGNGRWTRGMVDGLAVYARAYTRTPGSGPGTGGGSPVADPPEQVAPVESSGAGLWLLVLPGALVVGGVGWGGWVLLRRRRATRAARASLSTATDDLAAAWVAVDEAREYVEARVASLPAVDDATVRQVRADHAAAVAARYADAETVARWRRWHAETVAWSRREGRPAIIVAKEAHTLTLYVGGTAVRTYRVDLGFNWIADKSHAGDGATPEGRYRVVARKANGASIYYKALLLDYPNQDDRIEFSRARRSGAVPATASIGGLIEIHGEGGRGRDWTKGCVALTNTEIDELFARVGLGTPVTIVGSDNDGAIAELGGQRRAGQPERRP